MKRLTKPMVVLVTILMGMGLLLLEPMSNSTAIEYEGRAGVNTNGLIQQLQLVTNGGVTVSTDTDTGKVRFVGTELSSPMPQPASLSPGASAEEAARGFMSAYGEMFGLADQASQLVAAKTSETEDGRSFVRFQQLYEGVPVLGGELIVQVSSKNHGIISANGEMATADSVDTVATVSPSDAKATALGVVSKEYGVDATAPRVGEPQLWIYNPSILGVNQDRSSLVWRMDVESTSGLPIRELVLVDAHMGFVALHFNQVETAKNRQVYDANCTSTLPGSLERSEGESPTGDADVDNAYDYTGYTYDFYWNYHGRDSIDDAGMTIVSTVNYDPNGGCDYENAGWSGSQSQMVFGTGFASACDVVAHELTHGVTDYESNLYYYMQSGAIAEAFSDIWGEFVELTYNPGLSSDRWLIGEDLPIGAIRDMQDPPAYGDPDKMTSTNYRCGTGDYGGVHYNSGIANKAAYLMVDGDTFNGYVVTGMGISKTAALFYEVSTNLLTSGSDYADLYDALQQAAINLGYSTADRQTVKNALDATEMNLPPTSCPATEAPILESGTPYALFSDNLENPSSGNWVSGSLSGGNYWYYPGGANPYGYRPAIYATSGRYNFWGYDYGGVADYYMAMTSDVTLPAGSQPYLHFRHSFEFENYFDGGVVEYSTNGGSSWQDAGALFTHNGYTGTVSTSFSNPLGGRSAFVGYSSGYISSRLDLKSLAGQSVRFRFRIGTDVIVGARGWFIDDILIYTEARQATITTSGLVSSHPATVHYVQAGVAKTDSTYGAWSKAVDPGSVVSIDNAVTVSSTERYGTNAATSWLATETATFTVPYYHQFNPAISVAAAGSGHTDLGITNSATLTYYRFGAAGTFNVFDSQSFSDWVDVGSTVSLPSTSTASTAAHRWYCPATASWTVNDASSRSATYWDQFKPGISVVTAGIGHTDLDGTNSATLTYTRFGAAGTSSVFDGQSFSDWVDTGSTASLASTSSASTSTHRWYVSGTSSWAVNDASSRSATYWDQLKPTISVVTSGNGHTDLDSTNCATLTYTRFGAAGTSSVFDAQSFNDWVDTGSTASLSNPSSGSTSTHRWYSPETASWAVNDTSSRSATYWDQFKPAISVVTAGTEHTDLDSTNCATLTYSRFGAAGASSVFDAQRFNDWVDIGLTASLSNPSSASTSTHRWYSSGTTSWAISDARSQSATYCEQFEVGIAGVTGLTSVRPTTITFTRNGATNSLTAIDTWTDWADAGSTLSVTKSVEGGWIGDWSTGDTTDWTVDSPISASIRYHRSYVGLYVLIGGLLAGVTMIGFGIFFLLRIRRKGYALRDLPGYLSDRLGF
jgi:bacillolysin